MMLSFLILGSANGVQNALMASFMMKAIRKKHRNSQMPAYLFIIQTAVCIGFIGAGFVHVDYTQSTLLVIGIATMIAGILGFAFNTTAQKKEKENLIMISGVGYLPASKQYLKNGVTAAIL